MMNFRLMILDFVILYCLLYKAVTSYMLNIKVVDRAILVQWNFTGHVTGTIRKYRVSYNLLPDSNITDIVVDSNTHFAIIATNDHPGRLYNISLQVETNRGLIQLSKSRFTRADCGGRFYIKPKATLEITSPHYPDSYEPGVFCKWSVFTNSSYAIAYYVKQADFGDLFSHCENSYLSISISGVRQYLCRNNVTKETRVSAFDVLFQSRNRISGSGFRIVLKSEVKSPNTPSNVVMKTSNGGIMISWSAPEGELLPITSYLLDYTSLPGGLTHKIKLSARMNRYIIRVAGHEGQMFVINLRAFIGDKMGIPKRLFFRPQNTTLISTKPSTKPSILAYEESTTTSSAQLTKQSSFILPKSSTNSLNIRTTSVTNFNDTKEYTDLNNPSKIPTSLGTTRFVTPDKTQSSHASNGSTQNIGTTDSLISNSLMNSSLVTDTTTQPSFSSTFGISKVSFGWTTTYTATHQKVEGTTQRESPKNYNNSVYFVPDVRGRLHPVYFNFKIKRRNSHNVITNNNTDNLKKQLRTKLKDVFQDKRMSCDLLVNDVIVYNDLRTAQIRFTVSYSMSDLLSRYHQDRSFRLIKYINHTNLEYLIDHNAISDDWSIDMYSIEQFRENEMAKQEVHKPCDIIKTFCKNKYTCVQANWSTLGIVCCKTCIANVYPHCNVSASEICINTQSPFSSTIKIGDKGDNSSTIFVVIAVTIVSILMALISGIAMVVAKKKKILCSKVDAKFQNRQGCIEMHDILQSKFIGDKNIELTGFKIYRKNKNKRIIGGSLPSRNNKKHKIDEDIEAKIKQLGLFIEDKETLKKRLHLKCSLRRGNSL